MTVISGRQTDTHTDTHTDTDRHGFVYANSVFGKVLRDLENKKIGIFYHLVRKYASEYMRP